MNAITFPKAMQIGLRTYTPQQLELIWRSTAKDCNADEFSQFVNVAGHLNLDPMRKQIYAFVYSKDNPDKRRMSIIVGIDGYRTVARRTGDYRPDDEPPRFTIKPEAVSETNPAGIIDCTVKIYFHSHGEWHPVPHTVEWQAYAPLTEVWAYDEKVGKKQPTGQFKLDPGKTRWHTDPKGMLAKCAEAGAIRKAFPDHLGGVYEPAEMDQARTVDLSPAEYAEAASVEDRLAKIGGKETLLFDFCDERGLHPVPYGKLHDECEAFLKKNAEDPEGVEIWRDRNHHQLNEFWALRKSEALDIKRQIEAILAKKKAAAREAAQ